MLARVARHASGKRSVHRRARRRVRRSGGTQIARPALFVDAASLAYRAYHAVPEWRASDGTLVNASLVERMSGPAEIVTGDRDLFALVKDPNVRVLYTLRGVSELAHVDEAWIRAKYGIPGDRYYDYAVLRGDPSDGLPGVHGIGEKTASALVAKHGSLDAILTATDVSNTIRAKLRADADYVEIVRASCRERGEISGVG